MEPPSIFEAARDNPDRPAVLGDGAELTYAELAERVVSALRQLSASRALEAGRPVGLIARPTVVSLVLLLALADRRVPMVFIHPRTPAEERDRLLARAGARVWFAPDSAAFEARESGASGTDVRFDDVFAIAPTSGSTGVPKLVVLGREAIAASADASVRQIALTRDDRWLLCLPLAHVGGLSIVTRTLLARGAMVLHDAGARGLLHDVAALGAKLHDCAVTVASFVPAVLDAMLAHDPGFRPPASLRAVLVGGAASSPKLLERALSAGFHPLTTYGLTEACSQVTAMPLGVPLRVRDGVASAGLPLPGMEVALDADDRIRVRGVSLCSGFVDAPFPADQEGWLLTEDRGRFDEDGYLYVVGRASERIVTGGENVDPLRVESILESVPGVAMAFVFGMPDERFGEIVACAVVCDSRFERREFERTIRTALARHEEPRRVAILGAFPRLPNGKIDRSGTRALAIAELGGA